MTREEAVEAIRHSKLHKRASEITARLEPSLRLVPQPHRDPPIGSSRIGDAADLPDATKWPRWEGYSGDHGRFAPCELSFLAQLNLAELPCVEALGLPGGGLLSFFYDVEAGPWGFDPRDREAHRVVYSPPTSFLRRRSPTHQPSGSQHTNSCALHGTLEFVLPDEPGISDFSADQASAYCELRDSLYGSWGAAHHRLGGHPQAIQGEMPLECQLASHGLYCGDPSGYRDPRAQKLAPRAVDWRLLLQLDTDEERAGWCWGDVGRLYYWIRKQDLAARDFSRTWLIQQCF